EHAEQEAEADSDRHGGKRVLPNRLFRLVCGVEGLVLGAVQLLVGDAADGRGQALDVGADGIDLAGQFLIVWGLGARGHWGDFLPDYQKSWATLKTVPKFREAFYSAVAKKELRSERVVVVKGLRPSSHVARRACRAMGFCRRLASGVGLE